MGEIEEVKGRIAVVAPGVLQPEVYKAGLGRVEHKSVPVRTLARDVKHPPDVPFGRKEKQRVIGAPHEPATAPHT